jgi:hypothetical protein
MKSDPQQQPPVEEEQITIVPDATTTATPAAVADIVPVKDEKVPPPSLGSHVHQLDTLSVTAEHLSSLLSPGDPCGFLPGPPPPSPEVPSRSIHTLPGSSGRSLDQTTEVRFPSFYQELHESHWHLFYEELIDFLPFLCIRSFPLQSCRPSQEEQGNLLVPHSHSSETLKADQSYTSSPNLSSAESSATLVGSIPSVDEKDEDAIDALTNDLHNQQEHQQQQQGDSPDSPRDSEQETTAGEEEEESEDQSLDNTPPSSADSIKDQQRSAGMSMGRSISNNNNNNNNNKNTVNAMSCSSSSSSRHPSSRSSSRMSASRISNASSNSQQLLTSLSNTMSYLKVRGGSGKRGSAGDAVSESLTLSASAGGSSSTTPRSSFQTDITGLSTPRSSFQFADAQQLSSKAGVVVTSSRASARRSSTASAASAFAAATAACSNPPDVPPLTSYSVPQSRGASRLPSVAGPDAVRMPMGRTCKRESMISTAATMRVLNVLRHWVSKHSQDFETDPKLMQNTTEFLEELVHNTTLLPAEHKAASQLLAMITKEDTSKKIDLDVLLAPPAKPSKETIESLSALEIAEGMTYLDHKIFISITGSEFLGQGTVFLPFCYPLLSVRDSSVLC